MNELEVGSVLILGGRKDERGQLSERLEEIEPGLDCRVLGRQHWRQSLRSALNPRLSVILAFDGERAPLATDILHEAQFEGARRTIIFLGQGGARRGIDLVRAGATDYFPFPEVLEHPELRRQLRSYLPASPADDRRRIDALLELTRAALLCQDLPELLRNVLDRLIRLLDAERGILFLVSKRGLVPGACADVDEDHAVTIASLQAGPIASAAQARAPCVFELPGDIPGDDPVAWALSEARLERGYILPITSEGGDTRALVVVATAERPAVPVPWLPRRAAEMTGQAIALQERLAKKYEAERSAFVRLDRRSQEVGVLYSLMRDFTKPRDLVTVIKRLNEALTTLVRPDIIGLYAISGRFRILDVQETLPLPLKQIHSFEQWFNGRLLEEFGEDALRGCVGIGSSAGSAEPWFAAPVGERPSGFPRIEWIPVPPNGAPVGAIALALTGERSFSRAQTELAFSIAEHTAGAVQKLTETIDERQTLIQSLLNGLPAGVALLDAYGQIVLTNSSGLELLTKAGKVEEGRLLELCGEPFLEFTVEVEQSQRSISGERRVGDSVFFLTVASVALPSSKDPDDESSIGDELYQPDRRAPPPATGYAIALRDVTETHEIRRQLIQSEKLSTLGEMVSGVAHELNNPLTGIRGYAELLLERKDIDPGTRSDCERIRVNTERCARIVADLLTFARKRKLHYEDINISALLGEVFDLLHLQLKKSKVTLKRDLDRDIPSVLGDPHQLRQVFINLINNAQQALETDRPGGAILVRVRLIDPTTVRVVIEDNGPGIAPEHLSRVFDPFFSTKPTGKGTGLGLSICYGIIKEHEGQIRVESPPGCGARFLIDLPAVVTPRIDPEERAVDQEGGSAELGEAPKDDAEAAPPVEVERSEAPQILLAEETPMLRRLIMNQLNGAGYAVDIALNADEVLATLSFMSYDLVITSVELPGLDAIELLELLKQRRDPHAERMVILAGAREIPRLQERLADQAIIFRKPFAQHALIERIARLLEAPLKPSGASVEGPATGSKSS